MSIVPEKLNILDNSDRWNSFKVEGANLDPENIKNDLGLQDLFMFAPTTNKIMINGRPSVSIKNKPTTLTAHPKKQPFGHDTATSTISMNFDTKKNHFGFNQNYLKPVNNKRPFGFQPLYSQVGENMEIPIEDDLVVDPKRVNDISMSLAKQVDELTSQISFQYDDKTQMIQTLDKGQSVQVDINELPDALQEKIKDAEKRGFSKMDTAVQEEWGIDDQDQNFLDPWIYVEEKEKHEIIEMTLSHIEKSTKDQTEIEVADEDSDKMPLPKYFQDLYAEFGTLKDFDLKEVIYEPKEQERFMARVRKEIENK